LLPEFEQHGLNAFEYQRQGRWIKLSYREAPEEVLEDRELAADWARRSYAAAGRAMGSRQTKGRRPAPSIVKNPFG
jgi:DNA transformation protein